MRHIVQSKCKTSALVSDTDIFDAKCRLKLLSHRQRLTAAERHDLIHFNGSLETSGKTGTVGDRKWACQIEER